MRLGKRGREFAKLALKLGVGAAVVIWVLQSHMVDFESLGQTVFAPLNLLTSLGFFLVIALTASMRWYTLARAQGLELSWRNTFELNMIGQFFNTFMPGAVGGDLIKAWYVAGREPKRKTKAVFTVLLDRALGLAVFCLYAGGALLLYLDTLQQLPELRTTAMAVWGICGAGAALAILFFSPATYRWQLTRWLMDRLHALPVAGKLTSAVLLYRDQVRVIGRALALSALSITTMALLFRYLGGRLGIPLDTAQYFFVVPLALTVSAIPLLPGGIGVGQVAFYTLFQWLEQPNPELGGTLCTLYQVYLILFNLLGAFFYLRFKRTPGNVPVGVEGAEPVLAAQRPGESLK